MGNSIIVYLIDIICMDIMLRSHVDESIKFNGK